MGKRASSAGAQAAAAKRAKAAEFKNKVDAVITALEDDASNTVPREAREMLVIGARSALAQPVEERHVLQDRILGHVRETFNGVLECIKGRAAEGKRRAADLTSQAEGLKVTLQIAEADAESAEAALQAASEKAAEAASALSSAKAEMRDAEKAEFQASSAQDKLEKEKAKYGDISERLTRLVSGEAAQGEEASPAAPEGEGAEAPAPKNKTAKQEERERAKREKDAQRLVSKFVSDITALGAEEACVASAASVLQKRPEERAGFDDCVVSAMREFMAGKLKDVEGRLAEGAAAQSKAEALVLERRGQLEGATATGTAADEAETAARAARKEKLEAKAKQEKAIKNCLLEASNHQVTAEMEEGSAKQFEELQASFQELCTRSSAPQPEPEAAVLEAAAPEAGPDAAAVAAAEVLAH